MKYEALKRFINGLEAYDRHNEQKTIDIANLQAIFESLDVACKADKRFGKNKEQVIEWLVSVLGLFE